MMAPVVLLVRNDLSDSCRHINPVMALVVLIVRDDLIHILSLRWRL